MELELSEKKLSAHSRCLICHSNELNVMNGYSSPGLLKCNDCGFVFMQQIPTLEELTEYYSIYAYDKEEELSPYTTESFDNLLNYFDKYRNTNNILDVGCGVGWFLEAAKKRNWNVYGTEFSATAVEICRKKNINMHEGKLDPDAFADLRFDVIVSTEVLEHINYPVEELKNMYKLLRKGGLIYITTPNFNGYLRYLLKSKYNIIKYPEHLVYFSKKTLHKALIEAGFRRKKLLTSGVSLTRLDSGLKNNETSNDNLDENLRKIMSSGPLLRSMKKWANLALNITGLGLTLKAYYEKP